ncbi:MAG: hypothetical protein KAH01_01440, partial [Caldisericia bacterium]|nr:hypothetical protein [Caldisericia bacterium]
KQKNDIKKVTKNVELEKRQNAPLKRIGDLNNTDSVDTIVKSMVNKDEDTGTFGSFSTQGSGNPREQLARPQLLDLYGRIIKHADNVDMTGWSKEKKLDKIEDFMSQQTQNIGEMAEQAYRYYKSDRKAGREYLQGLQAYMSTDTTWGQVGRGVKELFLDETTYASLGTGAVAKTALKKSAIKQMLKMMTQEGGRYAGQDFAKIAARKAPTKFAEKIAEKNFKKNIVRTSATAGGLEGAMIGGVTGVRDEVMESQGYSKDFDWGKVAISATAGTAAGATLGAGLSKLLKGFGGKDLPDVLHAANPEEITKVLETLPEDQKKMVFEWFTKEQLANIGGLEAGQPIMKKVSRQDTSIVKGSVEDKAKIKTESRLQNVHQAEATQKDVIKDFNKQEEIIPLTSAETTKWIDDNYPTTDYSKMSSDEILHMQKEIGKGLATAEKDKNAKIHKSLEKDTEQLGTVPEPGQRKNKGPITELLNEHKYEGPARRQGEKNWYLSTKVGSSVVAQLSDAVVTKNMTWKNKLDKLSNAWDNNLKTRKVYNNAYPGYKGLYQNSKVKDSAHKLDFEIDQLYNMIDELPNNKASMKEAQEILVEIKVREKQRGQMEELSQSKNVEESTRKLLYAQNDYKALEPTNLWKNNRQDELSDDWKSREKIFKKAGRTEGIGLSENIVKKIEDKLDDSMHKANEASATLKRRSNNTWDRQTINDKIKRGNGENVDILETYWGRKADLESYAREEIGIDELAYREFRRINKEIDTVRNKELPEAELNKRLKNLEKQYNDIEYKTLPGKENDPTFTFKPREAKKKSEGGVKDVKKLAEIEATRVKNNERYRTDFVKKLKKYSDTKEIPRWGNSSYSIHKTGEKAISAKVLQSMDSRVVSYGEIADMFFPKTKSLNEFNYKKIQNTEKLHKKINNATAKKSGLERRNFAQKAKAILFRKDTWDVSNSMGQIVSGLIGSNELASKTNMMGKFNTTEFRSEIAKKMMEESDGRFGNIDKDMVKELYTPHFYGQGAKSAVEKMKKIKNWDDDTATAFRDLYYDKLEEVVPELKSFKTKIESMISENIVGNKMEFKTWDGTTIKLNLSKPKEGTAKIKGRNVEMKATTEELDNLSRALMPTIIQSIDASIMKKVQAELGIKGTHDAFHGATLKEVQQIKNIYVREMSDLSTSNLLENIMKDLGYKGAPLKEKKSLDVSKFDANTMLGKEHTKGEIEIRTEKDFAEADNGQLFGIDRLIEEYMSGNNVHKLQSSEYKTKLIGDAGYTDMSTRNINDNVFQYQLASAHQRSEFSSTFAVPPPKGMDYTKWMKMQKEIFDDMRAGLEMNPMTNSLIKGKRRFTLESGKPVGDSYKTKSYQKILEEEQLRHKIIWNSLPQATKDKLHVFGSDYNSLKKREIRLQTKVEKKTEDILLASVIDLSRTPGRKKKWLPNANSYAIRQVTKTIENDEFQRLSKMRVSKKNDVVEKAEKVFDHINEVMKKDKINSEDMTKNLLDNGFMNISEYTKETAEAFQNTHGALRIQAKDYINQAAKALNNKSEEIGFFRNNSKEILEELGYRRKDVIDMEPIMDKLISMKAMTDDAWTFVGKNKDTDSMKFSLAMLQDMNSKGKRLFTDNPLDATRNFLKEVYTGNLKIDGTWDADTKYLDGILSFDREKLEVGKEISKHIVPPKELKTNREINIWAKKNRIKIGNKGFRKVVDVDQKYKTGRTRDFATIMSATQESMDHKFMAR